MYIDLSRPDLMIVISALNSYQADLAERESRQDYWYRTHMVEQYKQRAEDSKVLIAARMLKVDDLRSKFLSFLTPDTID